MLVAVYGGSFDPPHVGHAMVASWLLWTGRVQQVWLLPTFQHAFSKSLSPFQQRLDLCRAMASDLDPRITVLPLERELPRPSYTFQSLEELARRHPLHHLRLVVGADVLEQVGSWKRWDLIEERFSPIVVGRQGYAPVPGSPSFPAVSSSDIRAALARGEPVDHLVCSAVLRLLAA